MEACTAAGVWVSIVPDLLTEPTAELAVGLAIGLARNIRDGDALVRSGAFEGWRPVLYGTGLDGSIVSIVGMGRVGRAVAQRLSGFGCRILGIDPAAEMPAGVTREDLDTALATSDFIILCAPLTPGSHHQIGADALARMKPGALLINIGRGSVVDESAVAAALEAGSLGGYAADVFEMEDWALPDRPKAIDERLRTHPRTLFTPHLGSAVTRVRQAIEMRAVDNIADVLEGRPPRDAINAPEKSLAKRGLEIHLRAHLGAQIVDRGEPLAGLDMPEGPAVAGFQPLRDRAHAMDRADLLAEHDRAVGAHQHLVALFGVHQIDAGRDQAALDQRGERHPRRLARGHERRNRRRLQRFDRGDSLHRGLRVIRIALDTDIPAAEFLRDRAGGAGAVERIEHQIVRA